MHVEMWVLAVVGAFALVGLACSIRGTVGYFKRREAMREALAVMRAISGGTDKELRRELKSALVRQRAWLGVWS